MALLLRDVAGLSYTEIADSLEITLATVKWRIYKAREEVALALAREGITFGDADAKPVRAEELLGAGSAFARESSAPPGEPAGISSSRSPPRSPPGPAPRQSCALGQPRRAVSTGSRSPPPQPASDSTRRYTP